MAETVKIRPDQAERTPVIDLSDQLQGPAGQPVSDMQLNQLRISWVAHDTIKPNAYNPNKMTWHDRMLLRQSLLEDGWTQPIVCLPDRTIVDGEQRWTTAGLPIKTSDIQEIIDRMEKRKAEGHPESESILSRLKESKVRLQSAINEGLPSTLASITGGLVPITVLDLGDDAHKILSTIRHNRARGTHQIDSMAGLTRDLVQLGLDLDDLETRLGMDDEEISRFLSLANEAEQMLDQVGEEFSPAWAPVHMAEVLDSDPELAADVERSKNANQALILHQQQLADREALIARQTQERIDELQASGKTLTQSEKDRIRAGITAEIAQPEKPAPPTLAKILLFVTKDEERIIDEALGPDRAAALVQVCREILEKRGKNGSKKQ